MHGSAGSHHVVDQCDVSGHGVFTCDKGIFQIMAALAGIQVGLGCGIAGSQQQVRAQWQGFMLGYHFRQLQRLIKATLSQSCRMQRHRHQSIGSFDTRSFSAKQVGQQTPSGQVLMKFESGHQGRYRYLVLHRCRGVGEDRRAF